MWLNILIELDEMATTGAVVHIERALSWGVVSLEAGNCTGTAPLQAVLSSRRNDQCLGIGWGYPASGLDWSRILRPPDPVMLASGYGFSVLSLAWQPRYGKRPRVRPLCR